VTNPYESPKAAAICKISIDWLVVLSFLLYVIVLVVGWYMAKQVDTYWYCLSAEQLIMQSK
jgi:hypothetical protein